MICFISTNKSSEYVIIRIWFLLLIALCHFIDIFVGFSVLVALNLETHPLNVLNSRIIFHSFIIYRIWSQLLRFPLLLLLLRLDLLFVLLFLFIIIPIEPLRFLLIPTANLDLELFSLWCQDVVLIGFLYVQIA